MVRHYDCTNRQNLTIVLNMQTGPNERGLVNHPEQVEEGIKICAALIQQAVAGSIPLRFATNASTQQEERSLLITPEFSSQEGALELLRVLARLQVRSTRHIVDLFQQLDQQAVSSDLVLVTAYMDEDISVFASRLSQQWGARLQVLVLDYDKGRDWGQELELYYLRRETPFCLFVCPKGGNCMKKLDSHAAGLKLACYGCQILGSSAGSLRFALFTAEPTASLCWYAI